MKRSIPSVDAHCLRYGCFSCIMYPNKYHERSYCFHITSRPSIIFGPRYLNKWRCIKIFKLSWKSAISIRVWSNYNTFVRREKYARKKEISKQYKCWVVFLEGRSFLTAEFCAELVGIEIAQSILKSKTNTENNTKQMGQTLEQCCKTQNNRP